MTGAISDCATNVYDRLWQILLQKSLQAFLVDDSVAATGAGQTGWLNHDREQFFYLFCLDEAVSDDHPVRVAAVLVGRRSIVLMIRMLIVDYVFGIRSERALCREVGVNLAYRWFCGLSIEDKVPDHSAFSHARSERFRDSGIFRTLFERVVGTCIGAGLVGGEGLRWMPA
jgi:hypothetical protein